MQDTQAASKSAFSIAEFERTIGISHTLAYQLIKAGQIRTFTIGKRRFISADALRDFIAKREAA